MNDTPLTQPPVSQLGRENTAGSLGWGHTLAQGARLDEFEVLGLIGEGGFGIVYLAFDHSLERRVALKEYMPSSLAGRVNGSPTVAVKSQQQTETFAIGLKSFINEARLLAQFDHPALVKVYRFWEANHTAYMAMPVYEGPTLKGALAEGAQPPDEAWLRGLLDPLLDALTVLHSAQCFHRDIAPDNILLTARGPVLLDFGAARRVIGSANQTLTIMLKEGYAPIEQYGVSSTMRQGAWTDVYALSCVVRYAVTGKVPPASIERMISDQMEPLSILAEGRYSKAFLETIDAGLSVKPEDRPQDVSQFRALLDGAPAIASPQHTQLRRPASRPSDQTQLRTRSHATSHGDFAQLGASQATATTSKVAAAPVPRRRSRVLVWLAGAVAVAIVSGIALWLFWGRTPSPHPQASDISTAAATAAQPPAPIVDHRTGGASVATPSHVETQLPAGSVVPQHKGAPGGTAAPEVAVAATNSARGGRDTRAADSKAPAHRSAPAVTAPEPMARPAARPGSQAARCADLLQKASLEPLSSEDAAFMKSQCQ